MRLLHSIYGPKQASREWYKLFHRTLFSVGLKRATSDTSLYIMNHPLHGICIIQVYVDDLRIVSDSLEWITSAKRAIGEQFCMIDFGEAKFILGMDIVKNMEAGTISLSQEQCTTEILEKYGMLDSAPSKIPMAPMHYRDGEVASDQDKMAMSPPECEIFHADILQSVNFLCMCTTPDIAFAVSVIGIWQAAPTQVHMKQLKRLLRYLNGTKPMGITYGRPYEDNADGIKVFSGFA
jgi:hypothetical protein